MGWIDAAAEKKTKMVEAVEMDSGQKRLQELGYKQELRRTLSCVFYPPTIPLIVLSNSCQSWTSQFFYKVVGFNILG